MALQRHGSIASEANSVDSVAAARRSLGYAWNLACQQRGLLLQSMGLILLMAMVNLPMPMLNLVIIDHAIPSGDSWSVVAIGLLAFAVRALASGFQVAQNWVIWQIMAGIGHRLRLQMTQAMLAAAYTDFISGKVPGLVGRLSADVNRVQTLVFDVFRFVLRPLAMIAIMVIVMTLIDPWVTLLLLTSAPLAVFSIRRLDRRISDLEESVLSSRQELHSEVGDTLDHIRLVRAYNQQAPVTKRVDHLIDHFGSVTVDRAAREQSMQGLIEVISQLPWLTLVIIGSLQVQDGNLRLGELMAFIAFEQLLRSPLHQLAFFLLRLRSQAVGPERVQEVIALSPEQASQLPSVAAPLRGAIRLDNLHFSYRSEQGDHPVLRGLSLDIAAGERVAIVGPSGAGKSTLAHLLLGFWRPQSGTISIDDHNILLHQAASLRRHVGVVFQHNPLFHGSVRENVTLFSDDITDQALWQALELADAADFVGQLPQGLDTTVGVKGFKLSGGQRQRLAIARVALRQPPIVILDEATSSLDSVSEQAIQQAMDRLVANSTSITIAHRLSTVIGADRICYLEAGEIIEQGNHATLLARNGAYARLFRAQAGEQG